MFSFFRKKEKVEEVVEKPKVEFKPFGFYDLINYIKTTCGIDLEPKKDVLDKRFTIYCQNNDLESFTALLDSIKLDQEKRQAVIDLVTVNETYFYRELPQLEESAAYAKSLKKKINILSAPCASGEEVYSLAFLLEKEGFLKYDVNILGIDISSQAIEKAKRAVYKERSLHRLDEELKEKYFRKVEDKYHLKKELMPNINFKLANIFDESFKEVGKFDIVFSRNMMIYFNDEFKRKAVKIFHELLKDGGRFYAGHADLVPNTEFFKKIVKNRLYYYEKL